MFERLIQWFTVFTGNQSRDSHKRAFLPALGSQGSVLLILLSLSWLAGCGGSSQQIVTAQGLAQMQQPDRNQELQHQIMTQSTKASLADYKDYKVGPEDQLVIEIFGQDKLNRTVRVNGQGEITMPLVGSVKIAGSTPQEIEKKLEELYNAEYLVNPQITVAVKEFRHQRIAITGAVATPGSYELIGPRTLLEALAMAGGLASKGVTNMAADVINVIRHQNAPDLAKNMKMATPQPFDPKAETIVIDLKRLVSGQDPALNIMVRNGDVIHVPFAGTAYVLGGVKKPGNILVRENLTVSQAVAMGGGIDPIMGTNSITIMRFDDKGNPISINTNLNSIIARNDPDVPIKDNDVVVVKESTVKKTLFIIRQLLPIPSGSYSMQGL